MEEAKVQRLVQAAIHSPSPENRQPWSFEWDGRALRVFHGASLARLPSDPPFIMSFLGLGMVLEAIDLAASCERLEAAAALLVPDRYGAVAAEGREEWAVVSLSERDREPDPLAPEIPRRCSDRRPSRGGTLQAPVFDELRAMARKYPGHALHLLDRYPEELLDWMVSSLRMYTHFKAFWHSHGRWLHLTERAARKARSGFSLRAGGSSFREGLTEYAQFRFWRVNLLMRALERKRKPGSPLPMLSGRAGLCCISLDPHSPRRMVESGRLAFRMWLRLGVEGYAVAPLGYYTTHTAVLEVSGPPPGMPPDVERELRRGSDVLRRAFSIDAPRLPVWMFSTGLSPGPLPDDERTLRRPMESCYRSTAGSHPA